MKIFSVSEYLQFLNDTLISLDPYRTIVVEGEITGFKVSQQKWIWFDIKDENGLLSCFATTWTLKVPLEDGMKVRVTGYPKVYPKSGKMSFTVNTLELVGEGTLKKAYEALKKKMQTEGLFDEARKRPLPRFPQRLALITSPEAAAYTDFVRILNNRWGGVEVDFLPVSVQGQTAVEEILQAFIWLNVHASDYDVCVLTRGGGSMEDLIAFNSEEVARAVYATRLPVVCGIGHERDECLAEYVADVRASTPSNAAELVVPSRGEILSELNFTFEQMESTLNFKIKSLNHQVDQLFSFIEQGIREPLIKCRELLIKFQNNFDGFFYQIKNYFDNLNSFDRLLNNLDPKRLLQRGYGIVHGPKGIVKSIKEVALGDNLMIELGKGNLGAKVTKLNN
ncbi:MAG: Exodeoxyribonuclease 7 large subunit [Candidatus Magasanikbacteria bacterium GW2011_GWC2_40_17]|uniref:Exodeoxyribonuclease 7 large subunit n=1 Tax=Candidatus Magasanikbacteria bacterium GW2011_GWA2_42_32 TaxID=1619039 RepID=A0A0G1A7Q9_9BACT|nr:MAG: Exodeoxyribonuclease 7 large subunit [Candidatus Magasanikbacteria bacterium GW2011_GWC2_40_17]KKS56974.1 MAG: Exodeoxyribonuclease 7 large subunit [Candidatus Magasanikbacteria bacterium GW2011_GWA2_42_32]OGH85703.1 MAG: exodeoxyribonuclease VII large subunit [Candidatus Magasanikbacteria bacterium RIFOXYB2_FULL_38_10]